MFLTERCTLLKTRENPPVVSILVNAKERQVGKRKHRNPAKQEVKRCAEEAGRRPNLLSATNCFPVLAQRAEAVHELPDSFDNSRLAA